MKELAGGRLRAPLVRRPDLVVIRPKRERGSTLCVDHGQMRLLLVAALVGTAFHLPLQRTAQAASNSPEIRKCERDIALQKRVSARETLGTGFKRMAGDMRYFYTEAAIARPNQRSTVRPAQIRQWIWTWVLLFRQPSKKWSPAAKVWKKT